MGQNEFKGLSDSREKDGFARVFIVIEAVLFKVFVSVPRDGTETSISKTVLPTFSISISLGHVKKA